MDSAAFIVALAVAVVVGFWYLENEVRKSDGAHGVFAVRPAEKRRARSARRYQARGASAVVEAEGAPVEKGGASPRYRRKERAWDRAAKREGAEDF